MENIHDEVKVFKKEKARLVKENKDFKNITQTILEDVNDLNKKSNTQFLDIQKTKLMN